MFNLKTYLKNKIKIKIKIKLKKEEKLLQLKMQKLF